MSIFFIAILAVWLVFSISLQFSFLRRLQRIKKGAKNVRLLPNWKSYDVLELVPYWAFFSRVPEHDIQLLYRDRLKDGQPTMWTSIGLGDSPACRWIWNPDQRRRNVISNLSSSLLTTLVPNLQQPSKELLVSSAYVGLAMYVSSVPHCPLSHSTQFMIARVGGYYGEAVPEILFISPEFSL